MKKLVIALMLCSIGANAQSNVDLRLKKAGNTLVPAGATLVLAGVVGILKETSQAPMPLEYSSYENYNKALKGYEDKQRTMQFVQYGLFSIAGAAIVVSGIRLSSVKKKSSATVLLGPSKVGLSVRF